MTIQRLEIDLRIINNYYYNQVRKPKIEKIILVIRNLYKLSKSQKKLGTKLSALSKKAKKKARKKPIFKKIIYAGNKPAKISR